MSNPDLPDPDPSAPGAGDRESSAAGVLGLPESGPGSLAPVWARAAARLIDMVIIFSAASVVLSFTGAVEVVDDEVIITNEWVPILVLALVWCFYEVGGTLGQTRMVGKMLVGLRVRAVDADSAPSPGSVFMRWLLPAFLMVVPLFNLQFALVATVYLSALLTPTQQGFHDRLAHTLVVRTR